MKHRRLHQGVAGADGHAVAAGHTTGFANSRAPVPQNPRMRILPADGESLVYLQILAGLDAATAQNTLVGIVAVEGIGVVYLVRLGLEWQALVLDCHHLRGVVDHAVAVVVVADRAIEKVIPQDAVKRLGSR